MRVEELRIGNLVDNMGVTIRFDIGDWDCIISKAFSQTPMERYSPIPLTEEWLLKLGFEKKECKSYSSGDELIYYTFTSPVYGFLIWNTIQKQWWVLGKISICQPEHIHSLQNLYFALTGEELKLNN